MLKFLAIVALFALAISPAKKEQRANLPKDNSDSHSPSAVSFVNNEAAAPNQQCPCAETPRWWQRPEWWLCILGVPTLGFIGWQARATADAARATQASADASNKAADSALLNTQLVIKAERPWIVISVESPAPNIFYFKATNVGRTPAKITSIRGFPLIVRLNRDTPILLDNKEGESLLSTPPCLLPSTASTTVLRCDLKEMRASDSIEDFMRYIYSGLFEIWFYGKVAYYDTLEPAPQTLHETNWSFWLLPFRETLPIVDPRHPEHNTYT